MNINNEDTNPNLLTRITIPILIGLAISCWFLLKQNPEWIEANNLAIELSDSYLSEDLQSVAINYIAVHVSLIVATALNRSISITALVISIALNVHALHYYEPMELTVHQGKGQLVGIDKGSNGISIIKGKINNLEVIDMPSSIPFVEIASKPIGEPHTYHYYWREHDGYIIPEKDRSTDYFIKVEKTNYKR